MTHQLRGILPPACLATSGLLVWLACSLPATARPQEDAEIFDVALTPEAPPEMVPDEIVVEFDAPAARKVELAEVLGLGLTGTASLDLIGLRANVSGLSKQFAGADPDLAAAHMLPDLSGWYVVRFDPGLINPEKLVEEYLKDPTVKSAQTIGILPIDAVPNDVSFASQWHLNQSNDRDIDAPEGWNIERGKPSVTVAVLDTGVRYYHKDLGGSSASPANPGVSAGNMWINAAEKFGVPGVDDDGNGFVDDWIGWDFVNGGSPCWPGEDCNGQDNDPRDFNGHGTHCGGIVAAINNNGTGTSSPAGGWGNGSNQPTANGVRVMALRIGWSGPYNGQERGYISMASAASAFYYAANKGARIASCSWSSSNTGGIGAAVNYFNAAGGLIFKAAGNSNSQTADYLCSLSSVYCVAATDQNDAKASFSNYGTWVDISAPGVSILSTWHNHNNATPDALATMNGTSMACPLVASTAAAVKSAEPTWSAAQVWARVRDTADNINAQNPSYVGKLGSGRVNLHRAVRPATLLVSFTSATTLPGIGTVQNEDIAAYNTSTGSWSLYFDGSDVGLASYDIDALTRLPNGSLLISTSASGAVGGISIDDSDILQFIPLTLGPLTTGLWVFYFDGSDVGLSTDDEDIDGLSRAPDGRLVISTLGEPSVSGLSGLMDEDLIAFNATSLGPATSGTWSYYFDGGDVGLSSSSSEDVDGVSIRAGGLISLSTVGSFSVTGLSGTDDDAFNFFSTSLGSSTAGLYTPFFIGTSAGVPSSASVTAVEAIP